MEEIKSMNRRKSRETAMKLSYEMSIKKDKVEEVLENFKENTEVDLNELDMEYITRILKGVEDNTEFLDKKIEEKLINWKLNRLSKIDLAILRISVYELLFENDIPNRVSVNEAIELAKKFSPDATGGFINAVLDRFIKEDETE